MSWSTPPASVFTPLGREPDDVFDTREAVMNYREFLTYLFDREQTRELAVELAVAIDERLEPARLS